MATSGAVIARIVSQYSDKGSKAAQKDIYKMGKQIDQWSKKATKAYMVAGAAVAAFGLKVAKDSIKNAIEDQKSQAALASTLKNVTGATQTQIAAVEDYINGNCSSWLMNKPKRTQPQIIASTVCRPNCRRPSNACATEAPQGRLRRIQPAHAYHRAHPAAHR